MMNAGLYQPNRTLRTMWDRLVSGALCALLSAPVLAQLTSPPGALQPRRDTPGSDRSLNPQPLPPRAAPPATSAVPPPASAGDHKAQSTALPANLFQMNDSAIIIVGGKSMSAGEIKRELKGDLERLLTTPKSSHVTRVQAAGSEPLPVAPGKPGPMAPLQAAATAAGARMGAGSAGGRSELEFAASQKLNCDKSPPTLTRAEGKVAPGSQFTLVGFCLGKRNGQVEAIGQVPGGAVKLNVSQWRDDMIVVTMPALSGIADQHLALTAVRADGTRSAALQARLRATRQQVQIPPQRWAPVAVIDEPQTEGSRRTRSFTVSISTACALEALEVSASAAHDLVIRGFENGAPHESSIQIDSRPACTTHVRKVSHSGPGVSPDPGPSWQVCRTKYELRATGNCPIGINP